MSTVARPSEPAEYNEYSGATRWIILFALMLGTLMQVIDTSIVNVAIPQMMGNLGATLDQIGWVVTGYIIANIIVLPMTGWLSSTFGRKRYLCGSVILFTVASFLCGISWDLHSLVFFRVLQGIGGAALLSTAQATMMEIFPPHQIGMVQAIYGLGVIVGPTIGPTLGGWITDNYHWPWIFYINIPIGIIAAILTYMFVHDSKHERAKSRIDIVGIGLLAVGLGAMQTVLEKGNHEGWFDSALIVKLSLAAVFGLVTFVIWELRNPNPVVNLRVFKNRGLAASSIFAAILGFGLFGGTFVLPIFLQQLRGYTAQQSGFLMLPGALATAVMMPFVGKLVSKVPARTLVGVGTVAFMASMFMLHTITLDTGSDQLLFPLIIRGAAMGFMFVPLSLAALMTLRGREMAEGSGLFNLSRQIGGSLGIAILSTLLDHRTSMHRAVLLEHINIFNPIFRQRFAAIQAGLVAKGSLPDIAHQQALKVIDGIVHGQAAILAFEDIFYIVGVFFVLALPLLFLFNKGNATEMRRPAAK